MVKDGRDLLRKTSELNYESNQIFLKYNTDLDFSPVPNKLRTYINVENQFETLKLLHRAIPESVVKPIALLKRRTRYGSQTFGFVMEFVDGKDMFELFELATAVSRTKKVMRDFIVHFGKTTEIVRKIHEKGLAHGDLNTGNIMVTQSGRIKLIDPDPDLVDEGPYLNEAIAHDKYCLDHIEWLMRDNFTFELVQSFLGPPKK
ncbi:MAG: hypothetical protein KGH94_04155 [Candidatus Micrarchaeota archaeon]|nr:hypothetical protein [Candidatus Micrarchaeota archaeon]